MNKPLIRYVSETIDEVDNVRDAITTVVSINPAVINAIKLYKERKDKISNDGRPTPIVTADDIREAMMRPMMEETETRAEIEAEEKENTDNTEHTR